MLNTTVPFGIDDVLLSPDQITGRIGFLEGVAIRDYPVFRSTPLGTPSAMLHAAADRPIQSRPVGAGLAAGYNLAKASGFQSDSHSGAKSSSVSAFNRKLASSLNACRSLAFATSTSPSMHS